MYKEIYNNIDQKQKSRSQAINSIRLFFVCFQNTCFEQVETYSTIIIIRFNRSR